MDADWTKKLLEHYNKRVAVSPKFHVLMIRFIRLLFDNACGIGHGTEVVEGNSDDDNMATMKKQMADQASESSNSLSGENSSSNTSKDRPLEGNLNPSTRDIPPIDSGDSGDRDVAPRNNFSSRDDTPPIDFGSHSYTPPTESGPTNARDEQTVPRCDSAQQHGTSLTSSRKGKRKVVVSDTEDMDSPLTDIGEDKNVPKKRKKSGKAGAKDTSGSKRLKRSRK